MILSSAKAQQSSIAARLRILLPLDNGSQDIRALDGLRAVAALTIVAYHAIRVEQSYFPQGIPPVLYFLQTGVHLFFVLSGFLLFLPYARAMLQGRPLPPTLRFYRRRALRILPAYWVCLAVLVLLGDTFYNGSLEVKDVIVHIVLLHDAFPLFNRDYEGPFWTLAVEAQFYLLLPLISAVIARFVGKSRSVRRLLMGVGGLIVFALLVRCLDVIVAYHSAASLDTAPISRTFLLVTMGSQGKYLEVFGIGMLCSVIYVVTVERSALQVQTRWRLAAGALVCIIPLTLLTVSRPDAAEPLLIVPGANWDIDSAVFPLLIGLIYGLLLLAILWGRPFFRGIFEMAPLRFIGLISYSLYLWHWPVEYARLPYLGALSLAERVIVAFVVAYTSYQLVERPFLRHRGREAARSAPASVPERNELLEPASEPVLAHRTADVSTVRID